MPVYRKAIGDRGGSGKSRVEPGTVLGTTLRSMQQPMRRISWAASLCLLLPVDNKSYNNSGIAGITRVAWLTKGIPVTSAGGFPDVIITLEDTSDIMSLWKGHMVGSNRRRDRLEVTFQNICTWPILHKTLNLEYIYPTLFYFTTWTHHHHHREE